MNIKRIDQVHFISTREPARLNPSVREVTLPLFPKQKQAAYLGTLRHWC